MKALTLATALLITSSTTFAQTTDTTIVKKELSKEEKAAQKAKSEADLMEAYQAAGLTEAQIASCKEAIADANKKTGEIKKNSELSDADKETAKKAIADQKTARLKEIMGEDAYKKYNAVRKKQKDASKVSN